MANKKAVKRVLSGEQLAKAIAETIFGWKNVHKYGGQLLGKRPDKAGRWRKYKVPDYANDPRQAYAIDARMEQLACWERYNEELSESQWRTTYRLSGQRPSSGIERHSERYPNSSFTRELCANQR